MSFYPTPEGAVEVCEFDGLAVVGLPAHDLEEELIEIDPHQKDIDDQLAATMGRFLVDHELIRS